MNVYFTDCFNVAPDVLEKYGAFNISLINDLPLFIDPFLLFTSDKKTYKKLHNEIIDYLKFLRDQSVGGMVNKGLLQAWYMFPEVKQLWLGYSQTGNNGRGLGPKFAKSLNTNLNVIFNNFGNERITKSSHLEKVCLIQSGVGKDNISDFTANLIKEYLLEYTQKFAQKHINKSYCKIVSVPKATFDYKFGKWISKCYYLPHLNNDYVLLTPRDILTKDENWINRPELVNSIEKIAISVPDNQLRAEINQYLSTALYKDKRKEPTKDEKEKAYSYLLKKYPMLIEYYIQSKENKGKEAIYHSNRKVIESEDFFIVLICPISLVQSL